MVGLIDFGLSISSLVEASMPTTVLVQWVFFALRGGPSLGSLSSFPNHPGLAPRGTGWVMRGS